MLNVCAGTRTRADFNLRCASTTVGRSSHCSCAIVSLKACLTRLTISLATYSIDGVRKVVSNTSDKRVGTWASECECECECDWCWR